MKHTNRSILSMEGFAEQTEGVSKRVKNITVSAIKEMMHLAQKYPDAISLGQGTPDFITPEPIRNALKHELDTNPDIGKYAPLAGIAPLRNAIAEHLLRKRGITADPDKEVYVTVGAMEGISSALLTVVDPDDEVILLTPCFPSHIVQIQIAGGTPVFVPLDESRNWALDVEAFEKSITSRTKAVVLCSPANPTGTVFSEADVRAIARLAGNHNFWIITDEPYDFIVYDDAPFFSATQIPEIANRRIGCFSLSKEYAMTGFRIGYVYATAGVVNQMLKVHDSIVITAATLSQYAALSALQGDQEVVHYFYEEFAKRRDLICSRLDKLDGLFSYQKPQGAYYIFPRILIDIDDYTLAIRILKEAGVICIPGGAFGPAGNGHIRFCYAVSPTDLNKAFDRIETWWNKEKEKV